MTEYIKETELLYLALSARYGIAIHADPVELTKQRLYTARRAMKDPNLDHVQIRSSPVENELWLTNTRPQVQPDLSFLDNLTLEAI